MSRDEFEIEEGREVVRHTIVGGRPMARRTKKLRIPIGFEKTLYLAATDERFRSRLLADRERAVQEAGYELVQTEANIIESVPQTVLVSMIEAIDTKQHTRRRFMRNVAACVLAGTVMIESTGCPVTGAEPDPPQDTSGDNAAGDTDDAGDTEGSGEECDGADSETIEVPEEMVVTGSMPDGY